VGHLEVLSAQLIRRGRAARPQSSFAWPGTPGVGSLAGSASGCGPLASSGNAWFGTPGFGSPDGSTSNFSPSAMLSPLNVAAVDPNTATLRLADAWQAQLSGPHRRAEIFDEDRSPRMRRRLSTICSHGTKRLVSAVVNSVCSVRIVESAAHGWHTRSIARRRTRAHPRAKSAGSIVKDAPLMNCGQVADSSGGRR
jgi:hypothetical protein